MDHSPWIEWASAGAPMAGQNVSGDQHVVAPFPHGVLLAVIDGLGHGPEAAQAAQVAADELKAHAAEPTLDLVQRCHQALRRTRGAVLTVASFNAVENCMTWLGVGNVEGVLRRAARALPSESVLLRGGVVGFELPPLHASDVRVEPGDVLMLATDGIGHGFATAELLAFSPQEIADGILRDYGKNSDDALVLIVRFLRGAP